MGPSGVGPGSRWGRRAKGAEAGRRPRASRDRSRAGGGGIPCTFTWRPGSRLRWCALPPHEPLCTRWSAVARWAPSPSPPTPPPLCPWLAWTAEGALCPRSTPSGPKTASPLLGVVPSPASRGSWGGGRPWAKEPRPPVRRRGRAGPDERGTEGCRRACGRVSCWGSVVTVPWWPGSRAPRGGQGRPWAGSLSSGAMGPPLCWRPWAVGPRVPRWPTLGLGRRLLRGSCAPSRRPAVLFPRGCSGFWRPSPLSPSLCLAASPRLPADPVPRPGALVLLRPVVASHPCLPPPARR